MCYPLSFTFFRTPSAFSYPYLHMHFVTLVTEILGYCFIPFQDHTDVEVLLLRIFWTLQAPLISRLACTSALQYSALDDVATKSWYVGVEWLTSKKANCAGPFQKVPIVCRFIARCCYKVLYCTLHHAQVTCIIQALTAAKLRLGRLSQMALRPSIADATEIRRISWKNERIYSILQLHHFKPILSFLELILRHSNLNHLLLEADLWMSPNQKFELGKRIKKSRWTCIRSLGAKKLHRATQTIFFEFWSWVVERFRLLQASGLQKLHARQRSLQAGQPFRHSSGQNPVTTWENVHLPPETYLFINFFGKGPVLHFSQR